MSKQCIFILKCNRKLYWYQRIPESETRRQKVYHISITRAHKQALLASLHRNHEVHGTITYVTTLSIKAFFQSTRSSVKVYNNSVKRRIQLRFSPLLRMIPSKANSVMQFISVTEFLQSSLTRYFILASSSSEDSNMHFLVLPAS